MQHALRAPGALERFLPPLRDAGEVRSGTGRGVTSDAERLRAVIPEQWYLGDRRELEEVSSGSSSSSHTPYSLLLTTHYSLLTPYCLLLTTHLLGDGAARV